MTEGRVIYGQMKHLHFPPSHPHPKLFISSLMEKHMVVFMVQEFVNNQRVLGLYEWDHVAFDL